MTSGNRLNRRSHNPRLSSNWTEKLLSLKTIRYQYVRELDYPAEAIHSTMTDRMYMDFA
ncbi:hypothetical protein [Parapedobacter tibetensis]|uniref:hypothetical protein n=1 Tax=Parapedobacter tibetensis TaxID=2972951 RepID=UPI00214D53E7|nr:hypothetical protein [Parapedobacter tibetensis]